MSALNKSLFAVVLAAGCVSGPDAPDNTQEISDAVNTGGGGGAGACTGTGCDGLDPTLSFDPASGLSCSSGPTSPGSMEADNGTLELRWGPHCQVNWARFTPHASGATYRIWVSRQSPAFSVSPFQFPATAGTQYYSNQVFAPGPAQSCVQQWSGSAWTNTTCTPWI